MNAVDNNDAYGTISFASLAAADGIIVPDRLKALALMPDGTGVSYGGDYAYMRNRGECLVYRGGGWGNGGNAGVFFANDAYPRSNYRTGVGFRPAFIQGI